MAGRIPLNRVRDFLPEIQNFITQGVQKGISATYNFARKVIDFEVLVDDETIVINEANELYAVDGSTEQKGVIQLSNNYDSISESLAVTEKALFDGLSSISSFDWVYGFQAEAYDNAIDEIIAHTGYTSASGKIRFSSEYDSIHRAWKVFNKTNTDVDDCWGASASTGYIIYSYNEPKRVLKYSLVARNHALHKCDPKTWQLFGSNDNLDEIDESMATWDILDARIDEPVWTVAEARNYNIDFNKTDLYKNYKLYITDVWPNYYGYDLVNLAGLYLYSNQDAIGKDYPENPTEYKTVVINADTNTIEYWNGDEWQGISSQVESLEIDTDILKGQPVCLKANGHIDIAKAVLPLHSVVGLALKDTFATTSCPYQILGIFQMHDWSNVIGTEYLTPNSNYYLDDTEDGKLTTIPPVSSGSYIIRVGKALTNKKLEITNDINILI